MEAKSKSSVVEVVSSKGVRIPIYHSPVGGYDSFMLAYYQDGARKRERTKTLELARKRANELVEVSANGTIHVGTLTAKQHHVIAQALEIAAKAGGEIGLLEAVRQFFEAQKILAGRASVLEAIQGYVTELDREKLPEISFPDLVEEFLGYVRKGKSRRYKLDMQARLHTAAETFTGNIGDIKTADIDKWLEGMEARTNRTKNNYRNAIRTLFRFGGKKNFLPRGMKTEAEYTNAFDLEKGPIGIYTPEQMEIMLSRIEPQILPFVAIGGFAGLRSAEISRLKWENVLFDSEVIVVPARVAKTKNRRLVPILPALAAWLKPFKQDSGMVLPDIKNENVLALHYRDGMDAIQDKEGKPMVELVHNGLRHSYVSYRVADIQNVHQVSLEAGNSPKEIHSSYRELVTAPAAKKWFGIMPTKERLKEITAAIAEGL
jgi:integrase